MFKNYKLSFEVWGLVLFIIVMIPNFIWSAIPASNDILRADSNTQTLDTVASICQVLMIAALSLLKNRESGKLRVTASTVIAAGCCLLYFASWTVYYCGIVNMIVILGLTIPPCLAFLFFAIGRKNRIAIIPISVFTICHLIYGVVNFII